MESNFYCKCGNKFTSSEAAEALNELLYLCERTLSLYKESLRDAASYAQTSNQSFRGYVVEFFKGASYGAAVLLTRLIDTLWK